MVRGAVKRRLLNSQPPLGGGCWPDVGTVEGHRQLAEVLTLEDPGAACRPRGARAGRRGNPEGPRLVLSHANGLSADTYYPFWSLLCNRFDLVLYDFRNHGWNPVGDLRSHNVPTFARDNAYVVRAFDRCFGDKPKIGVSNPMSAVTAVFRANEENRFSALVLFDPPACAQARESQDIRRVASQLAERARNRQDCFEMRGESTQRLLRARAFRRLQPGTAELIDRTTLRRVVDGGTGYQLRCPRECEAQVLMQLYSSVVAADIKNLPVLRRSSEQVPPTHSHFCRARP